MQNTVNAIHTPGQTNKKNKSIALGITFIQHNMIRTKKKMTCTDTL